MELSIIIVNYNGGVLIQDTIRSVFATKGSLEVELIVVDNGSSDGSLEAIKTQYGAQVLCVEMGKNAGFSAANNAGLKRATGRYVLFLNPDTKVLENALQNLITYMDDHPEVGACGGNLYDGDMHPQFSYWMLLPGWRMEWHGLWSNWFLQRKHHGSQEHNFSGAVKDVAYIIGADLMVRKDVLAQVGGMDEAFFLFYEETELCYRIHQAGYRIVSVPQAHIIHLEGKTIDAMGVRREQMMRSRAIYMQKCCSPVEHWVADNILRINSGLRMLWFSIVGNASKKQFWKYTLEHV